MARKRLGELLLERRAITPAQLEQALAYQRQTGHRLGAALVSLGALSEQQLCVALASAMGLKPVVVPPDELDWEALHSLQGRFCEANDLFPISLDSSNPLRRVLTLAMADPLNIPAIEEIEFTSGMKVVPTIAPLSSIRSAIRRYYFKESPKVETLPSGREQVPAKMTIQRGVREEVVHTAAHRNPVDELPMLAPDAVREVTQRTDLAELISEQAELARRKRANRSAASAVEDDLSFLMGTQPKTVEEQLQNLESRFWALLRIMAKKGLISREEYLKELAEKE